MHPQSLYNILPNESIDNLHLDTYVILNRSDAVEKFSVDKISVGQACDMSYYIIRNEMNKFFVPLSYRSLNALYANEVSKQDADMIFNTWKERMVQVFSDVKLYKINIPFNYDNEILKSEMSKTLVDMMELK
jgi:hypothetical protein